MRGKARAQRSLLMVGSCEERIPERHPLRRIKRLVDEALASMSEVLEQLYAAVGRPSVPPERLLKAQLLIALFSVRSDRQFCEQLEYNLLYRWFLDMELDEPAFDPSTFSHNRKRLIAHDVGKELLGRIVHDAKRRKLLSTEHFSVDGTLIEAWASMKSFRPKGEPPGDSNGWSDFRGQTRGNATHESKTDPESRLFRKGRGREAKLSFMGHLLIENRHGLILDAELSRADGTAERSVAAVMLGRTAGGSRRTVAADKAYDTRGFVGACRSLGVTPHVAQNVHRTHASAIDGRTTRHEGYRLSQVARRAVERAFGWMKAYGGLRKSRFRGIAKNSLATQLVAATYNLIRLSSLEVELAY